VRRWESEREMTPIMPYLLGIVAVCTYVGLMICLGMMLRAVGKSYRRLEIDGGKESDTH
jgi:hypothetical protein